MELNQVIKERYSVREFSSKKVEKEKIEELLEIINYIPTAVNAGPQKVYVLESEESLEKIGALANTYQAPLVLLIAVDINLVWKNPKEDRNGIRAPAERSPGAILPQGGSNPPPVSIRQKNP